MLRKLLFLIRLFVYWLLFFQACRGLFVLYNYEKLKGIKGSEICSSFIHAIPLDISMACYLLVFPFLVALASNYFQLMRWVKGLTFYCYFMLSLLSILNLADAALYLEWGSKLNAYALSFMKYPRELMASMGSTPYLRIMVVIAFCIAVFSLLLKKSVLLHNYALKHNKLHGRKQQLNAAAAFLCAAFLIFLGIRGGLGVAPINQSAAYFSSRPVLNHVSVNTAWNLLSGFLNKGATLDKNPYEYTNSAKACADTKKLYETEGHPVHILNQEKPNVLFIVLESWTADVIEKLGGEKDLTDGFNDLCKDGLLFTNIYANGDRTDKGLVAVFSGYPSQPQSSIITQPEKMEHLPVLPAAFTDSAYHSAFYYGGESQFANMKAYLYHCGFQKIIDRNEFDKRDMNSKWGAHDGVVFKRLSTDISTAKAPFFYTLLTLSSHEPFEIPVESKIKGRDEADKFRNAIWYSDQSLAEFMKQAKTQEWYKNTLIILVADHGHRLPKKYTDLRVPGRFRIPLLITGGALKKEIRGTYCSKTGNQCDLAHTLLQQMGMPSERFVWSKDLLNRNSPDFASYAFNDGIGWVQGGEQLVFDNISKSITYPYQKQFADSSLQKMERGKAWLQCFFEDYIAK